jgi:hypothetical protein
MSPGISRLQDYYAYLIGPDGHIVRRIHLACEDDGAAQKRAKQLVDGHDVELWQLDRMIATFTQKK